MKTILSFTLLGLIIVCQSAFSCDEKCIKKKAEATHNIELPKYLSWKYCEGIALDFMTSTIRSLENYRSNHFNTKYKGPLRNTRNYLVQRREWLKECDSYMQMTKNIRIFSDDETTKQIFASIDRISGEFGALIQGATYASDNEAKQIMDQKINTLFKLVEDHKTMMHLKGRYVFR